MCNCASAEVKSQETETVFDKVSAGRYLVTNRRSDSHLQELQRKIGVNIFNEASDCGQHATYRCSVSGDPSEC